MGWGEVRKSLHSVKQICHGSRSKQRQPSSYTGEWNFISFTIKCASVRGDRGACASAIRKCSMVIARFRHLQTSFLLGFLMKYKRKACCVYKCGGRGVGRLHCVVELAYQPGVYVPLKALFLVLLIHPGFTASVDNLQVYTKFLYDFSAYYSCNKQDRQTNS